MTTSEPKSAVKGLKWGKAFDLFSAGFTCKARSSAFDASSSTALFCITSSHLSLKACAIWAQSSDQLHDTKQKSNPGFWSEQESFMTLKVTDESVPMAEKSKMCSLIWHLNSAEESRQGDWTSPVKSRLRLAPAALSSGWPSKLLYSSVGMINTESISFSPARKEKSKNLSIFNNQLRSQIWFISRKLLIHGSRQLRLLRGRR